MRVMHGRSASLVDPSFGDDAEKPPDRDVENGRGGDGIGGDIGAR